MLKLFGHPDSGHAYKVRFFLVAMNIEHDYEPVDIWQPRSSRSAEFQRYARYGEVPTLIDDDQSYVQSNAILLHLARRYTDFSQRPEREQTQAQEWLFWEANKLGLCLPQLRSVAKFDDGSINAGAEQWLRARYEHDINLLGDTLADGRRYVLGDTVSIADFSLAGYLFFADEASVDVPLSVAQWLNNLKALPGWQHPYELMA